MCCLSIYMIKYKVCIKLMINFKGGITMSINTLEKDKKDETIVNTLFNEIEKIIINNKTKMAYQFNDTFGKIIVENDQTGNIRMLKEKKKVV